MEPNVLASRLAGCGVAASRQSVERLIRYQDMLLEWNARMDLTAVTEEEEMLDRHFVDSLAPLRFPSMIPQGAALIDVGTGAGFPGLPLAIVRPDLQVTLLDAQQKRLGFLSAVVETLGLPSIRLVHMRAEDGGRAPGLREQFDVACARALASLPVLLEYLLPFVKVKGKALIWKGPAVYDEMEAGRRAAAILGGRLKEPVRAELPGRDWRHLLLSCEKIEKTVRQYPRKAGTPGRQPLGVS